MKKINVFRKRSIEEKEGKNDTGIKSPGLLGFFDHYRDLEDGYKQRRHKPFRGLFKDIEIQGEEYVLLSLIFGSIANIVSLTIDLCFFRVNLYDFPTLEFLFISVVMGSISGAIFSGIFIDIIKKRLKLIQVLLVMASVNMVLNINFINPSWPIVNFILIYLTTFVVSVLFLIQTTLFLEYSSILGRGRILSFMYIEMIVFLFFFGVFTQIGVSMFPILLYAPLFFLGFAIYFIHREKKLEKPPLKRPKIDERHVNLELIRILFLILFFSFTLGLTTPIYEIKDAFFEMFTSHLGSIPALILFSFMFIFSAIAATIIGYVFDFKGRLITISSLILIITIVNFSGLFELPILYMHEMIIISLYVAGVMTISLLIGDVAKRKNYSKSFTFAIAIGIFGLITGIIIVYYSKKVIPDINTYNLLILGLQYLASIITLILLSLSREALPHKEKEWYESLIHFYIIHKSGLLLYEHEFVKVEERVESDLVSGGIIGLTTILGEIVKGEERLRTIDHGDKKLMFKYSPDREVIFVLLIGEDLIVLRNKLSLFIYEFIDEYQEKVENLQGVIASEWAGVSKLIEKYFSRKYFEIPYERRLKHFYKNNK